MSRETYDVKQTFLGTGSVKVFTFNFKIEALAQLLVIEVDDTGLIETQRVLGTDTSVYIDGVVFDSVTGGGTVTLLANLALNRTLIILLANDLPTQTFEFRNKTSFSLPRFEAALDLIAGAVQRLSYRGKQAFRIHDLDDETTFNAQLPPGVVSQNNRVLIVNDAADGMEYGPTAAEIAAAESFAVAAAASAAAALISENNSATSETNAATSAAAALVSENNASTSETNAATSETNAATSETNAATSETNAATSETNAATSAADALVSENAAAVSEIAAALSESNAATSETNAATSAAAALVSELAAAASAAAAAAEVATHAALTATHGVTGPILGGVDVQVITNKDIDGGVATNARRMTAPKGATAAIAALTRKEGTFFYDSSKKTLVVDDGALIKALGGGGGGGFNWVLTGDSSPLDGEVDGIDTLDFDEISENEVFATIQVPDSYAPGTQIKLIGGAYFCNVNSDNVLFKCLTTLLQPGSTVLGTYTDIHTSTNTENTQTVSNRLENIGEIDLTDSSGEINSVAVAAGDKLRIRLFRDNANESTPADALARLLKQSLAPKFNA